MHMIDGDEKRRKNSGLRWAGSDMAGCSNIGTSLILSPHVLGVLWTGQTYEDNLMSLIG